ncbi:MAG: membrane dipeptidase [Myxococcota bacterium]|nr:membrane dipeptidase [Myxococcota bacterium]
MKSRPLWVLLALLFVFLFWAYEKVLPAFVERLINRLDDHPEWVIEERAQTLHDSIPVADLHADPLLWKRDWLVDENRGHTDLPRLQEGGVALQVLTAVTKSPSGQNYEKNSADTDTLLYLTMAQGWPMETWNSPLARALYQGRKLADWDTRAGDHFRVIRNKEELETLLAGRLQGEPWVGGVFGIEGAHALEGNLENLDALDELGLRVVGLTHFFDNQLGGSLHGESGEGLTDFGRAVVLEADRRGMTIDVAHASPQMVRDVMATIESPVILSHGGFKGVCDEGRNLDDTLMLELAEHGALIGVGFWDGAVCDYSPEGVVRAIQYGVDLIGAPSIALGSDYDGATKVAFDAGELAILTQTMLDQGMSEEEIRMVMGENAIRFFQTNLP